MFQTNAVAKTKHTLCVR